VRARTRGGGGSAARVCFSELVSLALFACVYTLPRLLSHALARAPFCRTSCFAYVMMSSSPEASDAEEEPALTPVSRELQAWVGQAYKLRGQQLAAPRVWVATRALRDLGAVASPRRLSTLGEAFTATEVLDHMKAAEEELGAPARSANLMDAKLLLMAAAGAAPAPAAAAAPPPAAVLPPAAPAAGAEAAAVAAPARPHGLTGAVLTCVVAAVDDCRARLQHWDDGSARKVVAAAAAAVEAGTAPPPSRPLPTGGGLWLQAPGGKSRALTSAGQQALDNLKSRISNIPPAELGRAGAKWPELAELDAGGADALLLLWLKNNLRTRWQSSHTSKYGGAPTKRPREVDAGERVDHGRTRTGTHAHKGAHACPPWARYMSMHACLCARPGLQC